MVLPPRSAVMQGEGGGITFNEYRSQTYNAFASGRPETAMTAGCYPNSPSSGARQETRRALLQHVDESSCIAGQEIFCWMTCMDVTSLLRNCSASEIVCAKPNGTDLSAQWSSKDETCMKCGLRCPDSGTVVTDWNGTIKETVYEYSAPSPSTSDAYSSIASSKILLMVSIAFSAVSLLQAV